MGKNTKKLLMQSFVKLLNQKQFNRITIQDIADDCGVNRNTFYYHFKDIYMVLEAVLEEQEKKVIYNLENKMTWKECLQEIIDYIIANKKAIYHIYNSINREILEKYIRKIAEVFLRKDIELNLKKDEYREAQIEFVIKFYKYAFSGIIIEWISSDFSDKLAQNFILDMEEYFHYKMMKILLENMDHKS